MVKKRMMGKGEDVEKADQRRHRRPSFFSLFFPLFFSCWRALYWRREAAPLVYRQGTPNSQKVILTYFCAPILVSKNELGFLF